ncbi:MAG: TetR/AcrR family transcriptional regulator [Polyangiaceae bacterium]
MTDEAPSSAKPKRGRPRAFDPALALEGARDTFLRYGYSGASLDALTAAMKLNKPSLYAAFGDKRALFRRVLDARVRELGIRYRAAFERGDSVESALAEIFREAVDLNLHEGGPSGCLIGGPAATEAGADAELAAFTRTYFALCDREVGRWFDAAYQLSPPIKGVAFGRLVTGIIHDLALRARVGESRSRLREYAKEAALALARATGQ